MTLPLPPYGSALLSRWQWNNPPAGGIVVLLGAGAWQSVKAWQVSPNDFAPLVLPDGKSPSSFNWPVDKCNVLIERFPGPGNDVINELVKTLLSYGANNVCLWNKDNEPLFLKYRIAKKA